MLALACVLNVAMSAEARASERAPLDPHMHDGNPDAGPTVPVDVEPLEISDPVMVAIFAETGDVCLSPEEEREVAGVLRMLTRSLEPRHSIILTGYSDATDTTDTPRPPTHHSDCLDSQLAGALRSHARVGLLRAGLVFEIGRREGLPGFADGYLPVLDDTQVPNTPQVVLRLRRSEGHARIDRRVELQVVYRPHPIPDEPDLPDQNSDRSDAPEEPAEAPERHPPPRTDPNPAEVPTSERSRLIWGLEAALGPSASVRSRTHRELNGTAGRLSVGLRLVDRLVVVSPRVEVATSALPVRFNDAKTEHVMLRMGAFGSVTVLLPQRTRRFGIGAHAGWFATLRWLRRSDLPVDTVERQRNQSPAWGVSVRIRLFSPRATSNTHLLAIAEVTHIPLRVDRSFYHDVQASLSVGIAHDFNRKAR